MKNKKDQDRLEKLEKTIEILNEYSVNILLLKWYRLDTYNENVSIKRQLNKEQYDLIKEVLEDE